MAVKAKEQITVSDISDAYSVTLTSEAYTFVGNTTGAPSGLSCTTQAVVYCGSTQCTKVNITQANITCPTGITAKVTNDGTASPTVTFTTAATITGSCEATIPVVVDGVTINKKFSFSVAKQGPTGSTGPTGAAGKGIKSVTNYYLASASGSGVTASTSGWTTTIQTITASKKYLWNYEKITYTDNSSSSTSPCIIGVYGDKGQTGNTGATGPTGNGIKSITEYYQISTSNTTAPTTWLTTVPTLTATNKYLWNYEKITYTNGTSVDTAKRVIGVYGDKGNTGATGPAGKDANQAVHYVASNGNSNMYIEFATIKTNRSYINHAISFTLVSRSFESSDVQIMFENSSETDPGLNYIRKNGTVPLWIVKTEASTWVLIIKKSGSYGDVTVKNYHNPINLPLTWTSTQVATLRSGAIAASGLQESKTATNYMNFDNNGLVIGDLTKGTLGRNVLIDSDSVDIRNGTNTLATFSDNLIELGKGNTNSAIKLCNGLAKIIASYNDDPDTLAPFDGVKIESDNTELRSPNSVSIRATNAFLNSTKSGEIVNAIYRCYYDKDENTYGDSTIAHTGIGEIYCESEHPNLRASVGVKVLNIRNTSDGSMNGKSTSGIYLDARDPYNSGNGMGTGLNVYPGKVNLYWSDLYDKYDKIYPNGVPVYGGGNGPDPNTTLDSLILSAHANAPGSGFKYIYTAFYDNKTTTSNRGQFAIPYGDSSNYVYYRFYYNGSWSAWKRLINDNENSKLLLDTVAYMHGEQALFLNEPISAQKNGVVFVWSLYLNGQPNDSRFSEFFLPKRITADFNERGHHFTTLSTFGDFGHMAKYVYIYDTYIVGHNNNINTITNDGVTFKNTNYVLRKVYGV